MQRDESWHLTVRVTGSNRPAKQLELEMLAGTYAAWVLPAKQSGAKVKEDDAVVFLGCETQALPIRFGPSSPIYVLDTQFHSGLMQFFITAKGSDSFWPSPDSIGEFAQRCEVTNYSDNPIFALSMVFDVAFEETKKNEGGGWQAGPGIIPGSQQDHIVEIAEVDGHGGKFTFYVWNFTARFAVVTPPVYAEINLGKSSELVRVRLKQPNSRGPIPMYLSPKKELLPK